MKRPSENQSKNNLFKYFNKVKPPVEEKNASSTYKRQPVVAPLSTTTIDLTKDDDDDLLIISEQRVSTSTPKYTASQTTLSSQSSIVTNSSRQSSDVYFNELRNNSKFNRKGWTAEDRDRGPVRSSQDSSLSKTNFSQQSYNKIPVKPKKPTAKPNYNWVTPNDVAPYSSNYVDPNKKVYGSYSQPSISVDAEYSFKQTNKRDFTASSTYESSDHYSSSSWYSSSKKSSASSKSNKPAATATSSSPDYFYISSQEDANDDFSYKAAQKGTNSRNTYTERPAGLKNSEPSRKNTTTALTSYQTDHSSSIVDDIWSNNDISTLLTPPPSSRNGLTSHSSALTSTARSLSSLTKDLLNSSSTAIKETPDLSAEQQRVFDMVVKKRESLFFTGSAGTGKSVLLRAIIEALKQKHPTKVAVTASTGIAACNINGCTLHSFAAIGMGTENANVLADKIMMNRTAKQRWRETNTLIIDEISMVDAELFDKLEYIAREIRGSGAPFGGLQVVVTGDFFQLPPVSPDKRTRFAFEANTWPTVIKKTVMLTQVFRQKDGTFIRILNEMRLGRLSDEAIRIFKELSRPPPDDSDIAPTELYPLRSQVDQSNNKRLNELPGKIHTFQAMDFGDGKKIEQCIAPKVMHLKKNAQVMLLKNIDTDLVNGSIGVVIGFSGEGEYKSSSTCEYLRAPQRREKAKESQPFEVNTGYPIVRFSNGRSLLLEYESWTFELPNGKVVARRTQIPLMLAWAISIHKSQGQTLDKVRVDLQKIFEKGQAYVALSRATRLESLQILNFDPNKVMAHPTVTKFYQTLQAAV